AIPTVGTEHGPSAAAPLYIGDDSEGIEFGELQEHPDKAAPFAEAVSADVHGSLVVPTIEEPIAKAVREGVGGFAHWWNHGPLNTPLKVAVLVAAAIVAVFNGPWLLAAAVVLGSVYVVYFGIRLLV